MKKIPVFFMVAFLLSGCGVDVATATATQAQLKAQEAKRAKEQVDQYKKQIDQINQEAAKRIDAADAAASGEERKP